MAKMVRSEKMWGARDGGATGTAKRCGKNDTDSVFVQCW